MRRFDLLVFDWDGTLFDSIDWIVECLQVAGRACALGEPDARAARSVIGLSLREAMAGLFHDVDDTTLNALEQAYRAHYVARPYRESDLFRGVSQMLEVLRSQGYRLAVATGKSRRELDRALDATKVGGYFDAVRCAGETASKPNPEMLIQIMGELEISPERTLMVGDSVHDLMMARNAQTPAAAVASGANTRSELGRLDPLFCVDEAPELLSVLP